MNNPEMFNQIDPDQMKKINGGGFAHDVGRVLRFFIMSCDPVLGTYAGVLDWQTNKLISEI